MNVIRHHDKRAQFTRLAVAGPHRGDQRFTNGLRSQEATAHPLIEPGVDPFHHGSRPRVENGVRSRRGMSPKPLGFVGTQFLELRLRQRIGQPKGDGVRRPILPPVRQQLLVKCQGEVIPETLKASGGRKIPHRQIRNSTQVEHRRRSGNLQRIPSRIPASRTQRGEPQSNWDWPTDVGIQSTRHIRSVDFNPYETTSQAHPQPSSNASLSLVEQVPRHSRSVDF